MAVRATRALALAALGVFASMAAAETVPLAVTFKLTEPDYKPLAGVPVRVAFGSDRDWQAASAGTRFTTDDKGEAHFTVNVALEKRMVRRPTNFLSSLVALPEKTDFLRIAAEVPWAEYHWLYAIDVHRFADGDCMLDDDAVYAADAQGAFTHKATRDPKGGGFLLPELKGNAITRPGVEAWNYQLAPDPADATGKRWTLAVSFRRWPAPVRR